MAMHLEQLTWGTRDPNKKLNIKVFYGDKEFLLEFWCKKSVTPRRESKPQLFIETRFHYSQARPQIFNRVLPHVPGFQVLSFVFL